MCVRACVRACMCVLLYCILKLNYFYVMNLFCNQGYNILIWQKDLTSENESQSQKTKKLFTGEHSDDMTNPSSSLRPLPRSKTRLPKSSKTKLKN